MAQLVAIEGIDGSGKQTQTALLSETLAGRGLKVATVSFPQYGQPSAALVEQYLSGALGDDPSAVNAYAASSFFAMDRFVSYLSSWKRLYEESDVLIADRYVTSNAIHQCAKMPREQWESFGDWLFDYEYGKLGLPEPDSVIYLHLDLETSQRLLAQRYAGQEHGRDIHERDADFLSRSHAAGEFCCDRYGWQRIECEEKGTLRSKADVAQEIARKLGM